MLSSFPAACYATAAHLGTNVRRLEGTVTMPDSATRVGSLVYQPRCATDHKSVAQIHKHLNRG